MYDAFMKQGHAIGGFDPASPDGDKSIVMVIVNGEVAYHAEYIDLGNGMSIERPIR